MTLIARGEVSIIRKHNLLYVRKALIRLPLGREWGKNKWLNSSWLTLRDDSCGFKWLTSESMTFHFKLIVCACQICMHTPSAWATVLMKCFSGCTKQNLKVARPMSIHVHHCSFLHLLLPHSIHQLFSWSRGVHPQGRGKLFKIKRDLIRGCRES